MEVRVTASPGGAAQAPVDRRPAWVGLALTAIAIVVAAIAAPADLRLPAALVAGCLALWLSEAVPPFVPTLILIAASPLALPGAEPAAALRTTLAWAADPVLALFLGGLALGRAAHRHHLDDLAARRLVALARGRVHWLAGLLMAGTAFLSMWMSNVAAAALVLAAAGPSLERLERGSAARRAVLVAVAMGANLGGIATPIGTGPNGIAIAELAERGVRVTFVAWMTFAVPLTVLLLVVVHLLQRPALRDAGELPGQALPAAAPSREGVGVLALAALAIAVWLTEPLHGVPASVVALGLAALLFGSGLLQAPDFKQLDWSTLALVAGGITMGRLIEATHLVEPLVDGVAALGAGPAALRVCLCLAAASLSALMSNTATAALLMPIAARLDPDPLTLILVAVATSVGAPFTISTPPNAMAAEQGATAGDLLRPGLVVLIGGVLIVALTGPFALRLFGM